MHILDLTRILRRGCPHEAEHDESAFVSFGISSQLMEAYGWEQGPRISFAIGTASTAMSLSGAFGRWAFGIVQPRRDRHGRMDIVNG